MSAKLLTVGVIIAFLFKQVQQIFASFILNSKIVSTYQYKFYFNIILYLLHKAFKYIFISLLLCCKLHNITKYQICMVICTVVQCMVIIRNCYFYNCYLQTLLSYCSFIKNHWTLDKTMFIPHLIFALVNSV